MSFTVGTDPEMELCFNDEVRYATGYSTTSRDSNGGVGFCEAALELRYNQGFTSIKDFEKHTNYWLSEFIAYNTVRNPTFKDKYTIKAGSGRKYPLGGHLHAVFSKPLFKYFQWTNDNSFSNEIFNSVLVWEQLLIPLMMPLFLIENPKYAVTRRNQYSYGQPFSQRHNNYHIEWRMPCSFLHDKELTKGVMGLWSWWCEVLEGIYNKQLSKSRIIKTVNTTNSLPVFENIDSTTSEYFAYSEDKHIRDQHIIRDIFINNINIYREINPRLFDKWAGYFLPMFEHILDKKQYDEDIDLIKLWGTDISQEKKPRNKNRCPKCGCILDVSEMRLKRTFVYCASCMG